MQLRGWRAELAGGAARVGWKIGRGLVPGEEHLEPVVGYLTSATLLQSGERFDGGKAKELRADAELALEIGPELEPVAFGAALELVDVARPPYDFESIVAGNIWHRAVAFGPLRLDSPDLVDAEVRINGVSADSNGKRVDPAEAAHIATELLAAVGERLEPRDRIICGSLVQVPVAPGDEVVADLGDLGHAGVRVL
jgi:2-keto-4-pentenoate hydratase